MTSCLAIIEFIIFTWRKSRSTERNLHKVVRLRSRLRVKGIEDPDDGKKWNRLVQWCKDATAADSQGREFKPLYVTGDNFSEWSGQISQFERFAELLVKEKPLTAAL